MSDSTTSKKSEEDICVICYTKPEYPKGRLACEHVYCWACIRDWLKKRSQCPLCQIQVHRVQKLTKGRIETKLIRERTAAHYLNELEEGDEAEEREHEAVDEAENIDISVMYARCSICSKSDNEDKLMLCDAIVYGRGPQAVRCNAAFHCYCLENGTEQPPEGQFICPFCTNAQLEREEDANIPGPSRVEVRGGRSRGTSNRRTRELPRSRSAPTIQEASESEMSSEECDSETSLEDESEADEDWSEVDDMVLAEDSDPQPGYSGWGRTAVTRTRRKKTSRKKKKVSKKKKSTLSRSKKKKTRSKRPASNTSTRVTRSPRKTRRKVRKTRKASKKGSEVNSAKDGGLPRVNIPVLSIRGSLYDDIPVDEPDEPAQQENIQHEPIFNSNSSIDMMTSIIAAQTKTLAPSCCKRVLRDGTIEETEAMTEYKEKLAKRKKLSDVEEPSETTATNGDGQKMDPPVFDARGNGFAGIGIPPGGIGGRHQGSRKNRSTRWDTPTTSTGGMGSLNLPPFQPGPGVMNAQLAGRNLTASSIPLPTGPPLHHAGPPHGLSLEGIPVPMPNRSTAHTMSSMAHPPISSHMALGPAVSSLNTPASTSFALNALGPPFGMGGNPLSMTTIASLGQQHALGQQQLLQLPSQGLSQVFPNLFQPSLSIGAMNNILAAGLLGNAPLGPPGMSQAPGGSPFVLPGQMQMATAHNPQLTQQLANLAQLQAGNVQQQARLAFAGVPPPPPMPHARMQTNNEVDVSVMQPLAERIRQLTEANSMQAFAEVMEAGQEEQKEEQNKQPGEWSGRKSASAEEEEASDADARVHKNGPMFDQARQLLGDCLKKAFKKKRITKDEYKEIMKKGVTALSQRSKLDEHKVNEYASKYIDYVLKRRKRRH